MILAVCGYGTHGKGTAASYIARQTGLRYRQSTSYAAAEVVFDKLKYKYRYDDVEEAWADRQNHRKEWADIIWEYNQPDGLTLYRDMLKDHDILEGVRRRKELQALKDHDWLDMTIWIDASERCPIENEDSCQIGPEDCDLVIKNNGSVRTFYYALDRFIREYLR